MVSFFNHCMFGNRMTWTVSVYHAAQFVSATGYQRPERMSWDKLVKEGVCASSRVLKHLCFVKS